MNAQHVEQLLRGLLVTLEISAGAALVAIGCAIAGGLSSLSRDPVFRWLARVYVEVFRGTSALVQLFWFYFAFPILFDIELSPLTCSIVVLGLNIGAYGSEVVRGAVLAVPGSQREAGIALNLSRSQITRYIVLPQAVARILPPAGNLAIELLKSTALVSMIAVTDLTQAAMFIRDDTLWTVELFSVVLVVYYLISRFIALLFRAVERRLAWGRNDGEHHRR